MTRREPPPNLWSNEPDRKAPRTVEPGKNLRVVVEPSRWNRRSRTRTLFTLLLLVVVGAAAWRYARPLVGSVLRSADIERVASRLLRDVTGGIPTEEVLRETLVRSSSMRLAEPPASKARWYVCFGRRGGDVHLVRDDGFDASERAFAERLLDEARLQHDVAGSQHDVFTYPLGALYTTVTIDDKPWCVVVCWSER